LNCLNSFSKNIQISNFTNIRPVGAELFHAPASRTDGRTDMKLLFTSRNFAKAPKNGYFPTDFLLKFENKFIVSKRNKSLFIVLVSSTFTHSPTH